MEHNPLMDAFRKEFLRRAERSGFYHSAAKDGGENIYQAEKFICTLIDGCSLSTPNDPGPTVKGLISQLWVLRERTLTPYALFRTAPDLHVCDEPGFRILSEFDDIVLAAKVRENGEMQFTTWRYRQDRTGVHTGHDCGSDFEGAKENFARRSGLVSEDQFFRRDELPALRDACAYCLENGRGLSDAQTEKLAALCGRLAEVEDVPPPSRKREKKRSDGPER